MKNLSLFSWCFKPAEEQVLTDKKLSKWWQSFLTLPVGLFALQFLSCQKYRKHTVYPPHRHILVYAAVLHMLHSVKSEEKKDAERVVK